MASAAVEYYLCPSDLPKDGVSSSCFADGSNHLLVSSWDSTVRLYDAGLNDFKGTHKAPAPVLDCSFAGSKDAFYCGGLDAALAAHDVASGTRRELGRHGAPIKCVDYHKGLGVVVTGSWDGKMKVWDERQSAALVSTCDLPGKVFTQGLSKTRVVVGCSGRAVHIFDLRKLRPAGEAEEKRTSSLKHQTRVIRCSPDGLGYVMGSVEGRVALEYFDQSPAAPLKKFAFKCHRDKGVIYPVNAISFNPVYGTFATGGCDGFVNVWDGANKKRLCQFEKYPTSIASLSFNHDGSLLAIAASYTFEEGDKTHPDDKVIIRRIQDSDVKPKPRAGK